MIKIRFVLLSVGIFATIVGTVLAADDPQPVHAGTRILRSGNLIVEVGESRFPGLPLEQGTSLFTRCQYYTGEA